MLHSQYSSWHLSPFTNDPWCVSIYKAPGVPAIPEGPDGMFILPALDPKASRRRIGLRALGCVSAGS